MRSTMKRRVPESSKAETGRSPTHEHADDVPSMPLTVSLQGRMLMRSVLYGWMCHVQPLSTTKATMVRRECFAESW